MSRGRRAVENRPDSREGRGAEVRARRRTGPATAPQGRDDLLVIGIGSLLRGDDRVGLELVRRLAAHFGGTLATEEVYEANVLLAERLGRFSEVLVIDARPAAGAPDCELLPLTPRTPASGGFLSHAFDWGAILAVTRALFGVCPKARLLAVPAFEFGLSETLSPACAAAAEKAFAQLTRYCAVQAKRTRWDPAGPNSPSI